MLVAAAVSAKDWCLLVVVLQGQMRSPPRRAGEGETHCLSLRFRCRCRQRLMPLRVVLQQRPLLHVPGCGWCGGRAHGGGRRSCRRHLTPISRFINLPEGVSGGPRSSRPFAAMRALAFPPFRAPCNPLGVPRSCGDFSHPASTTTTDIVLPQKNTQPR